MRGEKWKEIQDNRKWKNRDDQSSQNERRQECFKNLTGTLTGERLL